MRRLLSAASGAVPTVDGAFSPRPFSLCRAPAWARAASVAAVGAHEVPRLSAKLQLREVACRDRWPSHVSQELTDGLLTYITCATGPGTLPTTY